MVINPATIVQTKVQCPAFNGFSEIPGGGGMYHAGYTTAAVL